MLLLSYDTHNGLQCFTLAYLVFAMAYAYHSIYACLFFIAVPRAGLSTCDAAGLSFIMTFTVMAVVVSVLFNA